MKKSILLALFLAGCASAQDAPGACADPKWNWDSYRAAIEDANPTVKYVEFNNDEIKSVLRAINSIPPETGYNYTRIGYFSLGDQKPILLVLMMGNCVWEAKIAPASALKMMMGRGV